MPNEMSPPSSQPPAGWYPDPSGKPGQMYWDGQQWRTDIPPPAAAPAPGPTARPPWEKRPSFWSGMSRNTKIVLAAGAGLVAIVIVAMIGNAASGPSGPPAGPGQPAPSGRTSAPSGGHSRAYNLGYEWGNEHISPTSLEQFSCAQEFRKHDVASQLTNKEWDDWMQGCVDGVRAQETTEAPSPTKVTGDCTAPENIFNPNCVQAPH